MASCFCTPELPAFGAVRFLSRAGTSRTPDPPYRGRENVASRWRVHGRNGGPRPTVHQAAPGTADHRALLALTKATNTQPDMEALLDRFG